MSNAAFREPQGSSRGKRLRLAAAFSAMALTSLFFASCGGGGGGSAGLIGSGGAFIVVSTQPENNGKIFLNEGIEFRFSKPVDMDTVNFNTIAFTVKDLLGNSLAEQVVGSFSFGTTNGKEDRSVLRFNPTLPTNDSYSNGGFRPSRIYTISLVQQSARPNPVVKDTEGNNLSPTSPVKALVIRTVSGSTPSELFLDQKPTGPAVVNADIGPKIGNFVSLNELSGMPVEVRLRFDQPLNPNSGNVPIGQSPDPVKFLTRDKGRVFLEYDDPEFGKRQWIPAIVTMPANDASGATLVLRPEGVLPSAATVRVIVESKLEDLAGQNNRSTVAYNREVASFQTEPETGSRFDAVVLDFSRIDVLDPEAAFRDPVAQIQNGILRASFDFEGDPTPYDWRPTNKEVVLNTIRQQVAPSNGKPFTVLGGVFTFRDITVPAGVVVRGSGTNPLVMLATGTVKVDGHLSVDGGDGDQVNTLNSAGFPTAGGPGVCGGGAGGKASQNVTTSTQQGENGFGPGQVANRGGKGGQIGCSSATGSGGGGGSMATQGDPNFYGKSNNKTKGIGGRVKSGNDPYKADPGPMVFTDANANNNFYGRQVDKNGLLVIGEISAPIGGAGGGGGGDQTSAKYDSNKGGCFNPAALTSDKKGGGGGGGAGILVIKALGRIEIGAQGRVSADGGRGGGGEWAGSSRYGGSGGGGSGGMVILMSADSIVLQTHGKTWSSADNWDANFSVSADGNIGRNTSFGNPQRMSKYVGASTWDAGANNGGGFGGQGVVQLMTPPGTDADGNGERQDDNIIVMTGKTVLSGAEKTKYLVNGDIHPNPYLMPIPYSRNSQAQSYWTRTGASVRRENATGARAIRGALSGPEYFFQGLIKSGKEAGYLATDGNTGLYAPTAIKLLGGRARVKLASLSGSALKFRGRSAHVLRVASNEFPQDGSLTNYRCRLYNAGGTTLRDYQIIGHSATELYLNADEGPVPTSAASFEVLSKFFEVLTDGNEGLGPTYQSGPPGQLRKYPGANVQIGFAFHKDPSRPDFATVNGKRIDKNRYPQDISAFVFDLESEGPTSEREKIRKLHFPFAKVMMRFNLDYNNTDPSKQRIGVGPDSVKPGLRFVFLPYRY